MIYNTKNPNFKKPGPKKTLHFSVLIFFVCLLFTFLAWDHYFNSQFQLDRNIVSNLILLMGTLFSVSAGFFVWSLESGKTYLENEVKRRTEELIEKERQTAAAEARRSEAEERHLQVTQAYQKLKEAQDQLVQSEKLASVGRVVAGVVHELNTPLVTLMGYTKALLSAVPDEEAKNHLKIIERQGERCRKIVRDLLTFARWDKPKFQALDIREVLDSVIENLPLELKADQIQIVKKYPGSLCELEADSDQIQRVFLNIIVNAWHALQESPNPKKIDITVISQEEKIQVFFTDNGPGIDKENIGKIFEPFFTTKPAGKGTGLGLSLSYSMIQMHGGTISVQGDPGKGTVFVVELPRKQMVVHAFEEEAEKVRRKKVLVVDDEPHLVQFVTGLLTSWGYDFASASNGQEALEIISKERKGFDLILLDVNMPGLNGFETALLLQENPLISKTPIIFLTARADQDDELQALKLHVQAVLRKPFDYKELRQHILASCA